ncbi:hypothetical protein B296_00057734 [Ensete ventricosum]|uniref:Uncharacterized protein n=1 Tax=Ensete ventricosum TaxID=4639 RepID=A0A426X5C1_ENSVE|nr:hypothetical protein B296_00057734 [Ensete ventricosum]
MYISYGVFGLLHQSVDQGFNFLDSRFNFFLRALYPKEPSLALVEFLQARFKNIEVCLCRYKSLLVALFPDWCSRWCLLYSRRIPNFTLVLFTTALLMSDSKSLRASLYLQPTYGCLGNRGINDKHDNRLEMVTIGALEGDADSSTMRAAMLERRAIKRRVRLRWIEEGKGSGKQGMQQPRRKWLAAIWGLQ